MNDIILKVIQEMLDKYNKTHRDLIYAKFKEVSNLSTLQGKKPSAICGAIIYLALYPTKYRVSSGQVSRFLAKQDKSCPPETVMKTVYRIRRIMMKVKK